MVCIYEFIHSYIYNFEISVGKSKNLLLLQIFYCSCFREKKTKRIKLNKYLNWVLCARMPLLLFEQKEENEKKIYHIYFTANKFSISIAKTYYIK